MFPLIAGRVARVRPCRWCLLCRRCCACAACIACVACSKMDEVEALGKRRHGAEQEGIRDLVQEAIVSLRAEVRSFTGGEARLVRSSRRPEVTPCPNLWGFIAAPSEVVPKRTAVHKDEPCLRRKALPSSILDFSRRGIWRQRTAQWIREPRATTTCCKLVPDGMIALGERPLHRSSGYPIVSTFGVNE